MADLFIWFIRRCGRQTCRVAFDNRASFKQAAFAAGATTAPRLWTL